MIKNNSLHFLVALTLISLTQAAVASSESSSIIKEIWTCKSDSADAINSVKVVIDNKKLSASGSIVDGYMSNEDVALKLENEKILNYRLVGSDLVGHDSRNYSVQLIPNNRSVYNPYSAENKTQGQAVVIYDGEIDCLGDVSGAEVLRCDVKLVRAQ